MTSNITAQLQGLYVRSHQQRRDSNEHSYTAYAVEVHAAGSAGRTWAVWRRYSEFEQLASDIDAELTASTSASSWKLPALPPKRENLSTIMLRPWKGVSGNKDEEFIANRQAGLERFLRAILASKDERAQAVRQTRAWTAFLGADSSSSSTSTSGKSSANAYTASSWLEEYNALDGQVKEIQSLLHKRDALIDKGDTTAAHKASVDSKTLLAKQTSSMTVLVSALDDLAKGGLSEGELRRRLDMVAKMQDKTLLLGQLAANVSIAARLSSASRNTPNTANPENRTALLGSAASSAKPVTRVLGKAAAVQETEQTRTLDNMGLLQMQLQQVDDQDQKLNSLTAVIRRQKELATAIGVELNEQNEMLDGVRRFVFTANATE
jgi:regulator of vacuolar morphogenesis